MADFDVEPLFELGLGDLNNLQKSCGPRFFLYIIWFFIVAIIVFTVVILLSV